jgi:hypothetical protein
MPTYPKPGQVKIYIKALEDRVAELETLMAKEGNRNVSDDHWSEQPTNLQMDELHGGIQPLLNAVRDLSLDVAGSYVGGASTITLGRALESALAGKMQHIVRADSDADGITRRDSISSVLSFGASASAFPSTLSQIDQDSANKMVNAYLGHLYTTFPIMYSYDVIALHGRRHNLKDIYEESILNLIYGLGGHFLEKVRSSAVVLH